MADRSNTATIQFPTPTAAWADPTHFGIWTASSGGSFLGGEALTTNVDAPSTGDDVEFGAGNLTVEIPDGDFTATGAGRGLDGFLAGTLYISLHSGAPGNNGADELSGGGYARVAIAAAGWS